MKNPVLAGLFLFATLLAACGDSDNFDPAAPRSQLVVMNDDLQQLKDDFNANQGRVRLLFLSGPTCGICLRGMADLNDEYLAEMQNDDRLMTFVVHVPTMGAKQHHAVDAIPLLDGPRVNHYWEETGIIGQHYSKIMDVEAYVWDFWAIYEPDAAWDEVLPPRPAYYEHQLGVTGQDFRTFSREKVLDAERFAAQTLEYVETIDGQAIELAEQTAVEQLADGTIIPRVGQPRNVAVRQHIMGRGGYKNLKRITVIEAHGHVESNGVSKSLTSIATRPNNLQRTVAGEDSSFGGGLPIEYERLLQSGFEFDGLFVEWPEKGHEVSMSGMLKMGDILAWRLRLQQSGGNNWHLFLNSHSGAIVRADLLDEANQSRFTIRRSDFRETSGFEFAHRIEYYDNAGELLATEIIDEYKVDVAPFQESD